MKVFDQTLALAVTWAALATLTSHAADLRLTAHCQASFADLDRARQVLTQRDEFIQALSPFDRAARMRTQADPGEKRFLQFLSTNALPWTAAESNRLGGLLVSLSGKLERWTLPLPPAVTLVKTTGLEEGGAAYTRQAAILLSREQAAHLSVDLLAHELFHVLSRNNPEVRQRLYGVIGFHRINPVPLPSELARVRITNPDGVQNNWTIVVRQDRKPLSVIPVLYSSSTTFDPARGGQFFDYLVFKLLAVSHTDAGYKPLLHEGKPRLLDPTAVSDFFEQIGRNTDYILHPDEILADNFVLLLNGKTSALTPRILKEMDQVLSNRS